MVVKRVLAVLLLIMLFVVAFSAISITGIDASGFPRIKVFVMSNEGPVSDVTDDGKAMKFESLKIGGAGRPDVDIVFVFDTSHSMSDEIGDLKASALSFASRLRSTGIKPRLALVTFGDEIRGVKDFTDNVEEFKSWVEKLSEYGGGDTPEISLDAMMTALSLRYRSGAQKVMILVTDATYHYRGDGTPYSKFVLSEVESNLRDFGIVLFAVGPEDYKGLVERLSGVWIDIRKERSFAKVLDSISAMLADQYEISYRVEDLTPNKVHRVVVRAINTATGSYTSPAKVSIDLKAVKATGMGVVPFQLAGTAKGFLSARAAAIMDAQRLLLETVLGVRVAGTETMEDGILKDRRINTAVRGIVSGAFVEKEEFDPVAGIYRVHLRIDLIGETGLINVLRNLDFYRESEGLMVKDSYTLNDLRKGYIKAVGYGVIEKGVEQGRAIYKARNAAIADAQMRLLEIIEGTYLDSNVRVVEHTSYTVIRRQVEGVIRGAEIVKEQVLALPEYQIDGIYMVEMAVPLTQRLGILGVLLNEVGVPKDHVVKEELKKPTPDPVAGMGTITGLIIEAAGMGLKPALFPRLFSESGELLYSVDSLSSEAVSVMDYVPTIAEAKMFGRAGENPYFVKAVKVSETDVYISEEDARKIKEMIKKYNFFRKGAVVVVVGG